MLKYLCDLEDLPADAVCKITVIVSSKVDDRATGQFKKHLCEKHAAELGLLLGEEPAFRPFLPNKENEIRTEPEVDLSIEEEPPE